MTHKLEKSSVIKILKIEDEFNNNFKEVVRSFAESGHSMNDTAKILELDPTGFHRWMHHLGWVEMFMPAENTLLRKTHETWTVTDKVITSIRKAQAKQAASFRFWMDGHFLSQAGHAERLNIPRTTFQKRLKKGVYDHRLDEDRKVVDA